MNRMEELVGQISAIIETDEYAMDLYPGATDGEIDSFEQANSIAFPRQVRKWLRFADGCCLFDTLAVLYGVAHGQRIAVNGDGYACIGMLNYGDTVCVKNGSERIHLCGETVIEYADFCEFLTLVIKIGTGE